MKKGFTLVELAIVIVIIGLLVGGVLQGQELINQAKIRQQIKQLENWNAAIAVFKSKYSYLPGDIPNPVAATFNFSQACSGGCSGTFEPNGNGSINDSGNNIPPVYGWSEALHFFRHMKQAKLISDSNNYVSSSYWDVGTTYPEIKLGRGGAAAVSLKDGGYFFLGPTRKNDSTNNSSYNYLSEVPSLTPEEAFGLDSKLDDGIPSQGILRAIIVPASSATIFNNDTTLNSCLGTSNTSYNLSRASDYLCRIIIKSSTF